MKTFDLIAVSLALTLSGCMTDEATQDDPSTDQQRPETRGRHCVIAATELRDGEPAPENDAAEPTCFDTFSDAIYAATQSRVRLAPSITPDLVDDKMLNGTRPDSGSSIAAVNVIGIEYRAADFGGDTFTITNASTCATINHTFNIPVSFNDTISSARAFAGCNHAHHFENTGFTGAHMDCGQACSYIGDAMNDRTSSIRWTR